MKPLIILIWFFSMAMNLMALEPVISRPNNSPIVIDNGYNHYTLELSLKGLVFKTHPDSDQIICINNHHSHFVIYTPHSIIKGYIIGNCSLFSNIIIDKDLVSSNRKSSSLDFNLLWQTLFYGKAPPEILNTEVSFS